ncbi:MAG: class I SAM-dependent methyltransferase [Chloroflexi bacterium]|nr:class I SAM-dependent methyltransferase [Chloroflexota bacterium]
MPDQLAIYREQAAAYENLVAHEDYQHQLWPALTAIRSFDQADWVEWGAGTGRLTDLAAPTARSIVALDASAAMLSVAADKLRQTKGVRWQVAVTEHRRAPLPDQCADIAIAGWTIIYLSAKFVPDWQAALRQAIGEMCRVLRPGGALIIVETLGTGYAEPARLYPDYYDFLEQDLGFQHKSIRTDYQFASVDEAAAGLGFFFGERFEQEIRDNHWASVPECTGIWWKYV